MKEAIRAVCIWWILSVSAVAGKPILYVVHADWCPPCRCFDRAWSEDRQFRDALQNAFEVRELDWENPIQQAQAKMLGVSDLPTYIVLRGNLKIASSTGFTTSASELPKAKAKLMQDLRVEWPPARQPAVPAPPLRAPDPRSPVPQAAVPPVDQIAREQIEKTQQAIGSLEKRISESHESTRTEIQSVTERIREILERRTENTSEQSAFNELPSVGPEQSEPPKRSETSAKWISFLTKAGKVALVAAAPEFVIPGSIGLTALGLGAAWLKSRRRTRPRDDPVHADSYRGSHQGNVTVLRDSESRANTANHYVVKETDRAGEAYKEALRRITAAYKSDKPGIVDVARQVEHVAQEILRGQTVSARSQQAPRPGIWTDEE
jgi:thiol-disulfide isomerase/thioredoxin